MNNEYSNGLKEKEVIKSRKIYGSNEISTVKKDSFLKLLLETLGDPIIKILLIALAIKTVFLFKNFDWYETIGILIAILLASFISSISEYGSEKAFSKLQEESSKIKAKVKRDGKVLEIDINDIVVGDIVILQAGDKIVADGILIKGDIVVDESSLTGETKEIYKDINTNNKLYRGSVIYSKSGIMKVEAVGNKTFYGRISKEIQEKTPESPLKLRLRQLAKTISKIGYIGAFLGAFSYLFSVIVIKNGFDFTKIMEIISTPKIITNHLIYALTLAVTIIIVAVPEGLPMMITLVLSSNMKRMLKKNVLVRKLVGIETAGSINTLFFDKTGTITKGKLKVINFIDANNTIYTKDELKTNAKLYNLVKLSLIYNNESIYENEKIIGGNSTDKALLEYIIPDNINAKIVKAYPFDSKYKYSKTIINKGKNIALIKGSHEVILPLCTTYIDKDGISKTLFNKKKIENKIDTYVEKGIRVIMLAINDIDSMNNLTLLGTILIKDEVREEAKSSIAMIKKAGINAIMITGDNIKTAKEIAKEVNLVEKDTDIIIDSKQLNKMSDDKVKLILPYLKVVARALPTDKSRLVRISQSMNLVVGMTGDGVNDAPALKKADVGFSMGSGMEVAKEASDIVILDDNIKSIVDAILFGRTIFKSIRKFIIFQLSLNICALLVSVIGPLIGFNMPVTVMQMLWINMIMDTLAGVAFSYEAPLDEYMEEPPKKKDEKILNKYMIGQILLTGIYSSILCILFLKIPLINHPFVTSNNEYLMTAFFGLFIFLGIFNSFNARTHRLNILANLFKNKVFLIIFLFIIIIQIFLIYFGGSLFRTSGLSLKQFQIMLILAFSIVPIDFLRKLILKYQRKLTGV